MQRGASLQNYDALVMLHGLLPGLRVYTVSRLSLKM